MAVFLNNKVGLKINAVDLSDHVTSVTLNQAADELEVTAMGDTAHKFVGLVIKPGDKATLEAMQLIKWFNAPLGDPAMSSPKRAARRAPQSSWQLQAIGRQWCLTAPIGSSCKLPLTIAFYWSNP